MEERCISSVCGSVLKILGLEVPENIDRPNDAILEMCPRADKVVIYNPDAVAFWLYEKYRGFFEKAEKNSDLALKTLSVMPSVTPVCFASMYTGLTPDEHGIKKYEKPVLKVDTIFDYLSKAGKKVAIVSTSGDSISKIFLERNIDYFIFPTKRKVNKTAFKLIAQGQYDVIVIYNGDYDATMHAFGPERSIPLMHLKQNLKTYNDMISLIKKSSKGKKVFYGFCPDHGCHKIDGGRGAHGLDMYEDMHVIHFYGVT